MEPPKPSGKVSQLLSLLYFGGFPIVGSALLTGFLFSRPDMADAIKGTNPFLWILPLGFAIGVGLLPNTVIALAGGFLFGMAFTPAFALSYSLALTIGFFIARIIPHGFIESLLYSKPSWRKGLNNLKHEGIITILLLRLSPIFPFGITNLVLGWLGFQYSKTLAGSLLGMAPRGIFLIYLGSSAKDLFSAVSGSRNQTTFGIAIGLTAIALFGLQALWKRKQSLKGR